MFVSFDLLAFLFWLALSSLVPGALLSFSVFRKDEHLVFVEKLFIGFALGVILLPLIPFLAYIALGIDYSHTLALASVAILYAVALAALVITKSYEGFRLPSLSFDTNKLSIPKTAILSAALLLIVLLAYVIRLSTYSPVFQELDPYYYTDAAQQILTMGHNPFDDQTAWYPEASVNHRIIPEISYLEAGWYSLYTSGGQYDNLLLADIASMYPPLAAAMFAFFVYFLISASGRREWGVIAAGVAAFAPVLVYKLAAGEQEVQPYAFFALFFFFSMYAFALKRKDLRFSALAGLGFLAVALGSGSQLLALAAVMIFIAVQSLLLFLRDDDVKELRYLLISGAVVFVIGALLGSALLKDVFSIGSPSLSIVAPFLAVLGFAALLYAVKLKVPRDSSLMALGVIFIIGIIVYAATPVGDYVGNVARSGFAVAKYNTPLDRTIAEQGVAGSDFGSQMGFVAETYPDVSSILLWPVTTLLSGSPRVSEGIATVVSAVISLIFLPFSWLVNAALTASVTMLNIALETNVSFDSKTSSLLLFWIFAFWAALAYSLARFFKKEDNLFVLFAAIVMPPLIVGIIKAKYTIYAAAMLAVAIGFSLGPLEGVIPWLAGQLGGKPDEKMSRKACHWLLGIGIALVLLQFAYNGFSASILWGSTLPLFQNDPSALQPKFQSFCAATSDADVCAAAADPVGYAGNGTNYQYSDKLCALSIYSNYSYLSNPGVAPTWEATSAFFRCQRLASYWIDSMEWIRNSTEPGARVISWWDYGHWINFFGQRNAVIRNEHVSHMMIGAVAHSFLDGSPEELKAYMQAHGSRYALFDMELIAGGGSLGGKYGALNYLSCAWDNQTTVAQSPGDSECEAEHLWETIFITSQPCTISSISNRSGFTAYKLYAGTQYLPYYPSFCVNPTDANAISYCSGFVRPVPAYCVGDTTLADGQRTYATYYLNETYPNGDLKLNKALLQLPQTIGGTYHFGTATQVTLFYTEDRIWLENGEIKAGYEDRKGKFYDSNLYRGLFLNSIPGFRLAYTAPGGAVKIYEVED